MASGFDSLMRVNCAEKSVSPVAKVSEVTNLNAAIGECLFEYCVAIPRGVIAVSAIVATFGSRVFPELP